MWHQRLETSDLYSSRESGKERSRPVDAARGAFLPTWPKKGTSRKGTVRAQETPPRQTDAQPLPSQTTVLRAERNLRVAQDQLKAQTELQGNILNAASFIFRISFWDPKP